MLLGQSIIHVQRKCEPRIEKAMAKHSLNEFGDLRVWSFLKTAMRFLCFASRWSSPSYSSSMLRISWGGSWVSVFASVFVTNC